MISIIVTARNQATDLRSCLNAILDGADSDELEIIVACNGCGDETAQVARGFGPAVRVVEMPAASHAHALNVADRAASAFPRFYLQAGVVCHLSSIRRMAKHLSDGLALAIAPPFRIRADQSGGIVRGFYEIAQRLPSHQDGLHGSSMFGLSQEGKQRFPHFPPVVAIEEFIRVSLEPDQFVRLENTRSRVTPPNTFGELLAAETELIRGVDQLRALDPSLPVDLGTDDRRVLRGLFTRRPDLWLELGIYIFVRVLARLLASAAGKHAVDPWELLAQPTSDPPEAGDLVGELQEPG